MKISSPFFYNIIFMKHQIIFETSPAPEDIAQLGKGLSEYAKQHGHKAIESFGFFVRDKNSQVVAGCNGNIGYGWVYIDQLWVDESLRGQGYGTALMQAAEQLAKEKNCAAAAICTMDWEALDFYKKLGYQVEFARAVPMKTPTCYFLRKDFVEL